MNDISVSGVYLSELFDINLLFRQRSNVSFDPEYSSLQHFCCVTGYNLFNVIVDECFVQI